MDDLQLTKLSLDEKKVLLDCLGYDVTEDQTIVNRENNEVVRCKFSNSIVNVENASVLPGSTIIIETSPLTLSEYFVRRLKSK